MTINGIYGYQPRFMGADPYLQQMIALSTVNPNTNQPVIPATNPIKQDTIELSTKEQVAENKKGLSKGAKIGIGALATAAVAGVIYFATRGKVKPNFSAETVEKLNGLVANGKMNKTYLDIFTETHNYEGKKFVQKVYEYFTKAMGYDKHKPQLNIVEKYGGSSAGTNNITISLGGYPTKEEQIGVIRHELEHFRQKDLIYRAFGREAYIDAYIEPSLTVLKLSDEKCIEKFGKTFKELSKSELDAYKMSVRTGIESKLDVLENLLKEKGMIPKTSKEYAEAEKYLQATKEYMVPTSIFGDGKGVYNKLKVEAPEKFKLAKDMYKKYTNNELEKGAVGRATLAKDMYQLFIETIS